MKTELEKIRRELLILFADSIDFEFRIKATPLTDIIEGVDFITQTVKGKKYGSFHIDLCELTGKKSKTPES